MRDDVAGLEPAQERGHGGGGLAHVDHERKIERCRHVLGAAQHLDVVRRDALGQSRLDAHDHVPVAGDGPPRRIDVGEAQIHRVAVGQDTRPSDVEEHTGWLWGGSRDGSDLADLVGARRSAVDPSGHAARERHQGALVVSSVVGVHVQQARYDDLARGIDDLRTSGGDLWPDRRDPAGCDGDVGQAIQVQRGIDDAAAPHDQVVVGRDLGGAACRRHQARGSRQYELTPVQRIVGLQWVPCRGGATK